MKWIKDNFLFIILLVFIGILIFLKFNSETDFEKKLSDFESKIQLKDSVIKNIRSEKEDIVKFYEFNIGDILNEYETDLNKLDKVTLDYQNLDKLKRTKVIIYKDKEIKKTSTQGELWDFSLNIHNDFKYYVIHDKIEQKTSDDKSDLKDEVISFLKKELNRWAWTYGAGGSAGLNNYSAGFTISFSKRFKRY